MGADSADLPVEVQRVIDTAQVGHDPVVRPEGWVDCSCGWESNHVRLPTADEAAQREAIVAFDAEEVPPAPHLPVIVPGVPPTDQEVIDLHAYNDWQREWGQRVRPVEPSENTGDPDPARTNDTEWRAHVAAVGRTAAIAQHVEGGGTLMDVPAQIATFGDEEPR